MIVEKLTISMQEFFLHCPSIYAQEEEGSGEVLCVRDQHIIEHNQTVLALSMMLV